MSGNRVRIPAEARRTPPAKEKASVSWTYARCLKRQAPEGNCRSGLDVVAPTGNPEKEIPPFTGCNPGGMSGRRENHVHRLHYCQFRLRRS